ncbi:MAG: M23 family metallopeptidase [Candidatus Brennerbacteria bacterium]
MLGMKWRRGIFWAIVKAFAGVLLFVVAGAGIRAFLEHTPWTRTATFYAPSASSTIPVAEPASEVVPEPIAEEVAAPVQIPRVALSVSALRVEQSDTLSISLENVPLGIAPRVAWYDRTYDLLKIGERWMGFLGADAKQAPGSYEVAITAGTTTLAQQVTVTKRAFPVTVLAVTPELEEQGYTPTVIQSNVATENERLNAALIYVPEAHFSKSFVNPLGRISIVGAYGNIRKSGSVELQHLGVDLDTAEGSPVYVINDGVVNLAENFTNYGKTLVVDHGVGIFSYYLHLSGFNVKVGDRVTRGEVIAKSGNTGYSIAPHLHFSMRIRNASIDPFRFIEAANAALGGN